MQRILIAVSAIAMLTASNADAHSTRHHVRQPDATANMAMGTYLMSLTDQAKAGHHVVIDTATAKLSCVRWHRTGTLRIMGRVGDGVVAMFRVSPIYAIGAFAPTPAEWKVDRLCRTVQKTTASTVTI